MEMVNGCRLWLPPCVRRASRASRKGARETSSYSALNMLRATSETSGRFEDLALFLRTLVELLLPLGAMHGRGDLHGGNLVLRTLRGPVAVLRRDHVRAGFRIVEGGVDDARRHPLGHLRLERDVALAAR